MSRFSIPPSIRVRLDTHQRSLVLSRQHVQVSVRSLAHVPHTLLQFSQYRFAVKFFPFFVEIDPVDVARTRNLTLPQSTDEQVVLPRGESIAGIESQTGWRNGRNPENQRRLHAFLPGPF